MTHAKQVVIPEGYQVTRDGRVISFKRATPRELRQFDNGSGYGYPSVWVYQEGRRKHYAVYRLVAAVYLPPRPFPEAVLMHRDGNRANSHADNLRWGTQAENIQHSYAGFWDRRRDDDQRREFGSAPPARLPSWPRSAP